MKSKSRKFLLFFTALMMSCNNLPPTGNQNDSKNTSINVISGKEFNELDSSNKFNVIFPKNKIKNITESNGKKNLLIEGDNVSSYNEDELKEFQFKTSAYCGMVCTGNYYENTLVCHDVYGDCGIDNENGGGSSGGDEGEGESEPCENVLPSDLNNVNSSVGNSITAINNISGEEIDQIKKLSDKISNIKEKLDNPNLNANKRTSLEAELNNTISQQQDSIVNVSGDLDYVNVMNNFIKGHVNIALKGNVKEDLTYEEIDLQNYKEKIVELGEEFETLVNSENTHGIAESAAIIGDELLLFRFLTGDYLNNRLYNLEPSSDTEDLTRLEKLTKPHQVIKYLRKQIINHQNKYNNKFQKLENELNKINAELPEVRSKLQQIGNNLQAIQTELDALNIPEEFTTQGFSTKVVNDLPTTFDPDWEREFSNATVYEAMGAGLFMQAEQGIQIFSQQLGSYRNYLDNIKQKLKNTTNPVEKAALKQEKEVTKNNIKETQDRLKDAKKIRNDSLEESKQIDKVKNQAKNNGVKVGNACTGLSCNVTKNQTINNLKNTILKDIPNFKGKPNQFEKTGGFSQANKDFDELVNDFPGVELLGSKDGRIIKNIQGNANFPNGTSIVVRNTSSGGAQGASGKHFPTLDINIPGNTPIKIRYNP